MPYTREEIRAAFEKWVADAKFDAPYETDPDKLTDWLCEYMDAARQPEPT